MRRRARMLARLSAALILVAAASLAAVWPPGRALEAYRILDDLRAGPGPSVLKSATPAPTRRPIAYRVEGRARRGDLYRPHQAAAGGIVLVPGAARLGRDDPKLVAFAETMARARFLVLVPDIASLRRLAVRASDAEDIADAVRALAPRLPPGGVLGIAAVSYAVGPAVLAALVPGVRNRVDFVLGIGGYYDLTAVVTFFTTRRYRASAGAGWRQGTPNAYGKWLFVAGNAARLEDPADRALLDAMVRRKLADAAAPVGDLAGRLGPGGRAVYALLANRDPERVPVLIEALPTAVREELRALDLAGHDLSGLRAELVLVHGRADRIIPYTESAALAAAVPRAALYLPRGLPHAAAAPADLGAAFVLWRAVGRVLTLRDRGRANRLASP